MMAMSSKGKRRCESYSGSLDAGRLAVGKRRSTVAASVCIVVVLGGCALAGESGESRSPGTTGVTATSPASGTSEDGSLEGDAAARVAAAVADRDEDGVIDTLDDCPESGPNPVVDASGCDLFDRVLENVSFSPGDHRLGADSRQALMSLVVELKSYPEIVIRLDGHTDNRGNAAGNLELSKRRVMSVGRFLVANGVQPERLKPFGFGESRPIASNATADGRERNRRIAIRRIRDAGTVAERHDARQNAANPEDRP